MERACALGCYAQASRGATAAAPPTAGPAGSAALAPTIRATGELAEFSALDTVLVVTPAQVLGRVLTGLTTAPRDLVLCSKGIEAGTGRMMFDVASEAAPIG